LENNNILAFDLGATKLASALLDAEGNLLLNEKTPISKSGGAEVAALIKTRITNLTSAKKIAGIGICVPGIYNRTRGTVWAPNIPGWENYPLLEEVRSVAGGIPVSIDNDRCCYISGERWKGAAKGCTDAIFLAVGTGIGAGILVDGKILRGSNDIAGAIGWMALERPFRIDYAECGCFESSASGDGIAKLANSFSRSADAITAHDVFEAYDKGDAIAEKVIDHCIQYWGMAVANLVSLFNPQKIIFGGGVFGPAVKFIPAIYEEAAKWAQPISMQQVKLEASALGPHAGLYGAAYLALQNPANNTVHEK